jgi:hypothetical protein
MTRSALDCASRTNGAVDTGESLRSCYPPRRTAAFTLSLSRHRRSVRSNAHGFFMAPRHASLNAICECRVQTICLHRTVVAQYCAVDRQAWMDRFVAQLRRLGAPCKGELLYEVAANRHRTHGHHEPEESATTEFASWPPIVDGAPHGR